MTVAWPDRCGRCDRQCETADSAEVGLCSYGVNYLRVNDELLIAGVVLRDDTRTSVARSKMLKTVGKEVVLRKDLLAVRERAALSDATATREIDHQKAQILSEYRESEGYKRDIVELLQPSLQQTFAQVHDYRSLVSQIVQNVNVLLQSAMPGEELNAQLDKADTPLRSIYWSARLMEFKLDSALFLAYPERITDPNKARVFRLHGSVKKYISIYTPLLVQRRLRLRETGTSFGNLMANPDAVGVVPHAFIDNAIKYAPDGTDIDVMYEESDEQIILSVRSLGPKISKEDHLHIFELFYRGRGARETGEDGTGFGLGLAQHVASMLNIHLSASQESQPTMTSYYRTTFQAVFPKPGPDERPPALARTRLRTRGGVTTTTTR